MSLRKAYQTDEKLERDGIRYDTGGAWFMLARAGGANHKYQKVMEVLTKPYRKQIQNNTIDGQLAKELTYKGFARAVVRGWGGVTMADVGGQGDEPAPFNEENCVKLFQNLPELFAEIQEVAQNHTVYLANVLEEDAGN